MSEKELLKIVKDKTKLIDNIIEGLESKVKTNQSELFRFVIEDFVDQLETEDGRFLNSIKNKRLLALLDETYSKFTNTVSIETIGLMIRGLQKIVDFNNGYFSLISNQTKLVPIQKGVIESVNAWLGITKSNEIKANGYLDTILKDATIKNEIRNQIADAVITQKGYSKVKQNLKEYIVGKEVQDGKGTTGAMQKYYRNFVYDTFSHVDRANGDIIAKGLELNHAIYEGGLIKTTRPFCRERNGKVFTRDEIMLFDPPTAKPPAYDPLIDLGGFSCRHHLNWIPYELAIILRPDLVIPNPPPLQEAA